MLAFHFRKCLWSKKKTRPPSLYSQSSRKFLAFPECSGMFFFFCLCRTFCFSSFCLEQVGNGLLQYILQGFVTHINKLLVSLYTLCFAFAKLYCSLDIMYFRISLLDYILTSKVRYIKSLKIFKNASWHIPLTRQIKIDKEINM